MTRNKDAEAEMRHFMDPNYKSKDSKFIDAPKHVDMTPEMKEFADKIKEKCGYWPRNWQSSVMNYAAKGRDTVVRAGTGAGKSICYQGLTLLRPRASVLVCSPLIALMEDQVFCPFVLY
jgi:superfamily II DNA helicase RecQ